ncbi:pyridoxamine 5'-phosphate oxidase family protein [Billgrantia azerbaijanica]|nr:pyridoxamine 5'-phosphate oxidase family protein [Halomonas azerbaijanica]
MRRRFTEITFTESVKRAQQHYGTRDRAARRESRRSGDIQLGSRETAFIAARDSFYMATVSETGWPYVQHRGGHTGFLKVLGPTTLGFADFRGNLEYLSVGNLAHDDRVALILMDYPHRRRLKLLGRARSLDLAAVPSQLVARMALANDPAPVERVMLIEVEAFDWNCAQYITPRFTEQEMEPVLHPLKARIAALETLLHRAGIRLPDDSDVVPPLNEEKNNETL